ncbi:MAG TPA: metallophosphoesterase [Longimicrobium sp.]|nr:metallophosphoesterase [Longimicrobium sp.]
MQKLTTDRGAVLRVMERTLAALEQHTAGTGAKVAEAGPGEAAELARQLRQALEWARTEEPAYMAATDELEELRPGGEYISHHPVIALTQTAMEQFGDEAPGSPGPEAADAVPVNLVADKLRVREQGPPPFREHASLDDFRFALGANDTVVLVGDFGTAKPPAIRVAQAIREVNPDHVIHLGDIYPSGTPELARRHFIDVWREHGPPKPKTKFWALNGNHEMAAQGTGYFGEVLEFCEQPASYFSLQNEHWKLIGLDTAYEEHDLHQPQKTWLHARLAEGESRNILLTHHQMFSAVDGRPHDNRDRLFASMQEFVGTDRIFGWFWGHEHRFLSYAREPQFGNYLARAIGHGGKEIKHVTGVHRFPGEAPRVLRYWEVRRDEDRAQCLNGFATLRFDGPQVMISYADETGFEWNTEIWPDDPHA